MSEPLAWTFDAPVRFESKVRHSRFVVRGARVDFVEETVAFLESVADPAATHNCWAWVLDRSYRFSDDGEPAGTAGRPILAAIEGKRLNHAMIVVTRYFGGIKLGAGGLVRAYSGAAARCIDQADLVEIVPECECSIEAAYVWTGQVYAALETLGARKLGETFAGEGIRIRACVRASDFDELRATLRDTTRGEARVTKES